MSTPSCSTQTPPWDDLKSAVHNNRQKAKSTSSSSSWRPRTPTSFTFRSLSDVMRTRLYFLSSMYSRESTIIYVDVDDSSPAATSDSPLNWNSLIESTFQLFPSARGQMSREEQLMSERKRCGAWGITSYESLGESGRFVFPTAGSIFGCTDSSASAAAAASSGGGASSSSPIFPYELRSTECRGVRLIPAMCPANPDLVAFVGRGDIWATHSVSGHEERLTHVHNESENLAEDPFVAGLPSYVMQEEFNRYSGFWWRPICEDGRYSILYEVVDESEVEILKSPPSPSGDVEEFRFPRTGAKNAKSTLMLVSFSLDPNDHVQDVKRWEMGQALEAYFPWLEYVVRAGWTPDGKFIWCQLLDRRQQRLELVLLPPSSFNILSVSSSSSSMSLSPSQSKSERTNGFATHEPTKFQVIYKSVSENWVSVSNILTFLPCDEAGQVRFIFASEETGFRHLYLVTAQAFGEEEEASIHEVEDMQRSRIVSKVALTSGRWVVCDKEIWVDDARGLVYFQGMKDTPLEKHLYAVSIAQPDHIKRLTSSGYSHSIQLNDGCSMFVTAFSSIETLSACQVFRISHSDSTVDGIICTPAGWVVEPKPMSKEYQCPELFSHTIPSGDTLYGLIYRPSNMKPDTKYPVVLSVYGGPEVQLVTNTYKGNRQVRNHLMASQGYCVVCVDSRGSQNRGSEFETHLRHRMGQVEMQDQVEVLRWLGQVTGYMDMDRVAVHGWSYGGYLSLMALAQYPNLFKVSIAGAPVVSWMNYDTGYTERYMDLPHLNEEGYKKGSILTHVPDFPDQPNRLLIVHGLMDENVHFFHHTSQLVSHLVKHGKPYQLQIYPGERHSLRHLEASEHYETTLLSFLKTNL